VSAAVTLAPGSRPRWLGALRDSKQLTPRQRSLLAPQIKASALDWGVGWASSAEVDRFGILPATRLSMHRALAALSGLPDFVLVDGRDRHEFDCGYAAITRGDAQVASIAAASVVAKVARDAWMEAIDGRHAAYGFATNRGYATADHLSALEEAGPCEEHRRSFAPVRLAEGDAPVVAGLPLVY